MRTLLFLTLILLSCSTAQERFDKKLWNHTDSIGYPDHRDAMLTDLLKNHRLKGKHFYEIEELFGGPLEIDTNFQNSIDFNIVTEFGWNIDPVYQKDLVLIFNDDSIVADYYITEYPE